MRERNLSGPAILLASAFVFLASGCSTSTVEGPQITRVPAGYGFSSQMAGARNVFLEERPSVEYGWSKHRGETHGSVEVNVWDRAFSPAEVRAARDAHAERWGYADYDEVSATTIDGRDALFWFVRQSRSRECVGVVAYADQTYTIEYYSAFPDEQDDAEMLAVVRSFRRAPGRLGKVLIPLVLIGGIAGGLVLIRRLRG